jgi:hypothetical protein
MSENDALASNTEVEHRARIEAERRWLDAMLLEGLESPVDELTDADWAALRQGIIDRHPELADCPEF